MPFTYHCHSGEFCGHASGRLEEVVLRAIELGYTHLGLSEHMPRFREKDLYDFEIEGGVTPQSLYELFDAYVLEARRLQRQYADRITILVGMETEFITHPPFKFPSSANTTTTVGPSSPTPAPAAPSTFGHVVGNGLNTSYDHILELVRKHSLDYFVGSVHHVREVPLDMGEDLLDEVERQCGGTEQLFIEYFDDQYKFLSLLKPKVVGHFDLIRLYRPEFPLTPAIWERIDRNIALGVELGVLFEINSRGLKKGLPYAYPFQDILRRMISMGARFTLCDDSHGPRDIAIHYADVRAYLLTNGVHELWHLDKNAVPTRVEGNWWEHPFWRNKTFISEVATVKSPRIISTSVIFPEVTVGAS